MANISKKEIYSPHTMLILWRIRCLVAGEDKSKQLTGIIMISMQKLRSNLRCLIDWMIPEKTKTDWVKDLIRVRWIINDNKNDKDVNVVYSP